MIFDLWIGDTDGRDWYDVHSTDPVWLEMRFIRDHLIEKGDVVLECGGHHGCTTVVLSHWVGATGQIKTFEPSPSNCKIIAQNILQNKLQNVTLENKAVGRERGTICIDNLSNSSVTESGDGLRVELTCLDEYKHLRPTFLKIDVEGFEMQVLQGAAEILSTRPKLAIEIHTDDLGKYGASVKDLLRLIDVESYKIWIQWDDDKEPEEFDPSISIDKRVHLFGVPLRSTGPKSS